MISAAHLRFCPERGRLLDLLCQAASEYARLANELGAEMSNLSALGYRNKRSDVERARAEAQHAKEALAAHQQEHGCSTLKGATLKGA